MTKPNFTHIAVVLDRSGSMASVKDSTAAGFNAFLKEQRAQPGEATMTLTQFDTEYQVDFWNTPLDQIKLTYQPRGGTALLDALGKTITDVGVHLAATPEEHRPSKVVFVVITDGQENSSRDFERKQVFDMIKHQTDKYGWDFLFLGANQDAIVEAGSLGIDAWKSMTYAATDVGTRSVYSLASKSVTNSRMGGTTDISLEDRIDYATQNNIGVSAPTTPAKPRDPATPDANGGSTP